MPLHLQIENETSLPDGGPIAISVSGQRGLDIGRDQYLDWVLPDPTRFISGKHCEIRYRDGQYWLTDVSTNGTFLNGSEFRVDGPRPLRSGDRIEIGRYIIAVTVQSDTNFTAQAPVSDGPSTTPGALWNIEQPAAPAINPQALRQPSVSAGLNAHDPLDWIMDMPAATFPAAGIPASTAGPDIDWAPPPSPGRSAPSAPLTTPAAYSAAMPLGLDVSYPTEQPRDRPQLIKVPPAPVEGAQPEPFLPKAVPAFAGFPEPSSLQRRSEAAKPAPEPPALPVVQAFEPLATPPVAPDQAQLAPGRGTTASGGFRAAFARGAGVDESVIAITDEQMLATMLGAFVRLTADNLRQLQMARAHSKGAMRSGNMTMIQAVDNNPLRFSPTTEDALRILFGPQTTSYLSLHKALESSFHDLKKHQLAVFTAMQAALGALLEDLDPARIEATTDQDKGVAALLRPRQARLWERYETAWKARAGTSEHGMLDVFMRLFAESYDRDS
ncbi:MAG: type VI secretion system-associated FHA domain protein TagH [Hyphomicrobiales bacterium]|nr:type VI secretion system-associated FHA domain protein TagH [Hyphomicrobiales bacterium]